MRTYGSLLKGGFVPRNFTWLYKKNSDDPYIQYCRTNCANGDKSPIYKPYKRKCKPDTLYIHPYFPDKPIMAVEIVKPFPFAKARFIYHLEGGILTLKEHVTFTEVDIYNYPTFFKPIYQ